MPPTQVSEPGLARPPSIVRSAALVAHGGGHLGVVGARPSRRCGARAGCRRRQRASRASADMWPIDAQRFEVGVLGDELRAVQHLLRSRAWRALALGDHAEAVRAAASAALACSRICSGSIIACIGVSASA